MRGRLPRGCEDMGAWLMGARMTGDGPGRGRRARHEGGFDPEDDAGLRHRTARHGWGGRDFGGPSSGGRGFGGGHGPGGRRRRVFDQSELQSLLLALIIETPRHGYDLIRAIETISGGEYAPSPGVVYPALTFMEEAGLIEVVPDEGTRKAYRSTPDGYARAEEEAERVEALKARLGGMAAARDRLDPAPVRRAMHALKTAVVDRLSSGDADREVVLAIADALDEATRKIERSGSCTA